MIDFDDELERAQARLRRQAELMNTAVSVGQIGEPYLRGWLDDLSPEDRALFEAKMAEIKAAFDQMANGAARLAEILTERFQEIFEAITEEMQHLAVAFNKTLGGQFLPVSGKTAKRYDPDNARAMWKWDPATARPDKRPFREVRFNQVPVRRWRNGRKGR